MTRRCLRMPALLLAGALLTLAPRALRAQDDFPPPEPAARVRLAVGQATTPIRLDGRLDEPAWAAAPVATGFRQVEPEQNAPSRFETVVRVLQDAGHLYVGVFCRDSLGARGVRVQDLRREFDLDQNDRFTVVLDAFNDGRNAVGFSVTPYGSQAEMQVYDDEVYNSEWEGMWRVRAQRTDSGWTAELAIPWATIRHGAQTEGWGVNFVRVARRANEVSAWQPFPRNLSEYRVRYSGLLTGVTPSSGAAAVRLRPYGIMRGQRSAASADSLVPRAGGEVIWSPSANTTVELTANTDFAQADVDRQVVNLTRFSVFFPERRQFFLESANLFSVGTSEDVVVQPFFSRRIGLADDGTPIPLTGGLRLVRRDAHSGLGVLVTRQRALGTSPAAITGVARYSHNVGASGRLGALVATRLDERGITRSAQQAYVGALDGLVRLGEATTVSGMASWTRNGDGTAGVGGFWSAYRQTNTHYVGLSQTLATRHYDPATGFVSRTDVLRSGVEGEIDWRPSWRPASVRSIAPYVGLSLIHGPSDGRLQEGELFASLSLRFQSGGELFSFLEHGIQRPAAPFPIARGITIGAGNRDFTRGGLYASTDPSARLALDGLVSGGGFFGGERYRAQLGVRWTPAPRLALRMSGEMNRLVNLGLERADVTTWLLQPELRAALNPRTQLSAFWQYSSDAQRSGWNVRFSWEFQPLSYLFIVYNDVRATGSGRFTAPALPAEQLIVKLQYSWEL